MAETRQNLHEATVTTDAVDYVPGWSGTTTTTAERVGQEAIAKMALLGAAELSTVSPEAGLVVMGSQDDGTPVTVDMSPSALALALGAKNASSYASLSAAFAALSSGDTLLVSGTFTVSNCITSTTSNITVIFQNAVLNISDAGTSGTITNTSSGKIGLLFKSCDHITLLGKAKLIGTGTVGSTTLAGIVFDTCNHVVAPAELYLENMAAGRMVFWCNYSLFGDITAYRMKGQQTFGSGSAGSAEVVVGCKHSKFGSIVSKENYKPIRYLSLAADGSAAKIDNESCEFGFVTGTVATSSIEGSALAIRSAKNCQFAGCSGDGFSNGLYLVRYNTDTGWSVTGNKINSVTGNYPATGASVDAALMIDCDSGYDVGSNEIGSIIATVAGEWGVYIGTGKTQIGQIDLSGSPTRGAMMHSCSVQLGQMACSGQAYEALLFGQGANLDIGLIDVRSGYTGAPSATVLYNSAYGSGGQLVPNIDVIRYRQNSIGSNYNYVIALLAGGAEMAKIGHIDGTGASAQAYFGGDEFSIKFGRYLSVQAPTAAYAYTRNMIVWNSSPSAGGTPGWVCTTAGSPGTWKAMANLAA